jgi:predicted nucleotide-binding protein (sugar kinase/HSP70/actin superfamily)
MKKSVWLFILLTTVSFTCAADDVVYKHFEEEIQANPPARLTATVAEADLKLRVQPNLQAAVLVSLKKGDQVTIDYRTFA